MCVCTYTLPSSQGLSSSRIFKCVARCLRVLSCGRVPIVQSFSRALSDVPYIKSEPYTCKRDKYICMRVLLFVCVPMVHRFSRALRYVQHVKPGQYEAKIYMPTRHICCRWGARAHSAYTVSLARAHSAYTVSLARAHSAYTVSLMH